MIKETITYTDYDDVERTEDFWFHLSKTELMEMNFSEEGGLEKTINKIAQTNDIRKVIAILKDIILRSYGEKSLDGKRFIKVVDGHKLADDFAQSPAFDELFVKLASDENATVEFINKVIPRNLAAEIEANQKGNAD